MRVRGTGTKTWLLSSAILFSTTVLIDTAEAAQPDQTGRGTIKPTYHAQRSNTPMAWASGARYLQAMQFSRDGQLTAPVQLQNQSYVSRSFGISCVPYARQVSGISVPGNAWQWWKNAEGVYARGNRPEPGSVLNFRANGRMRLGHVAVVTRVVNPREIIVDQANWPSSANVRNVSHNVSIVDVSEANNWTAVRVELGHSGDFGSVYPTYGFIYNRPDTGFVTAQVTEPTPQPVINSVPSDLRPAAERPWQTREEVAEAPDTSPRRLDLRLPETTVRFGQ